MSVRIAVCDYGVGNLRSVERALERMGATVLLSDDPATLRAADGVVLPGVGAFGAALGALRQRGLDVAVADIAASGRPLLGVCLGFQLLFEHSDESGGHPGLGLLPGRVKRIEAVGHKVPHMGWNELRLVTPSRLLHSLPDGCHMYFVHSYAAPAGGSDGCVVATTSYGGELAAVCERGNVMGTQFHPEKSSSNGLRLYANFVALCAARSPATM